MVPASVCVSCSYRIRLNCRSDVRVRGAPAEDLRLMFLTVTVLRISFLLSGVPSFQIQSDGAGQDALGGAAFGGCQSPGAVSSRAWRGGEPWRHTRSCRSMAAASAG